VSEGLFYEDMPAGVEGAERQVLVRGDRGYDADGVQARVCEKILVAGRDLGLGELPLNVLEAPRLGVAHPHQTAVRQRQEAANQVRTPVPNTYDPDADQGRPPPGPLWARLHPEAERPDASAGYGNPAYWHNILHGSASLSKRAGRACRILSGSSKQSELPGCCA
jgi:hypothetical protein